MKPTQQQITELVGELTRRDLATLAGRRSRLRAAAHDLGITDRDLPPFPPIEEDLSLKEYAADQVRKAKRLLRCANKNRVAASVCPCCKKTFKQLAAHMKNKHPNYAEAKT